MITRTTPDIGYLDQDVFEAFAFHQSVRAGDTLYLSGIAPLRGSLDNLDLVGEGDIGTQLDFVLEILDRCLQAAALERRHLVTWTFSTPPTSRHSRQSSPPVSVPGSVPTAPAARPLEIQRMIHPAQQLEVCAVAVATP